MPRIALSMIVKDAAPTLRACLESVRGVADEIVIADTGSSDASIQIAREFGAHVLNIPWENDFAAARNRSLAEVQADWVLVLDADEVLDPDARKTIPGFVAATNLAGYMVAIRNYFLSLDDRIWDEPAKPNDSTLPAAKAYPAYVDHENVRLFRRDPRIYFVGRVHESVGSRIEECGMRLGRARFLIHHFGLAADANTRARKNRFYHELGRLKVDEMPQNAQAHLELGLVELENSGSVESALASFETACRLNPEFGVAWFFAGVANARLGKHRESIEALNQAEKHGRRTPTTMEFIGDGYYNLGEFASAARAYERALKLAPASLHLEGKLGLATVRRGCAEPGLQRIRRALAQKPQNAELHDRLILALASIERVSDAAMAAEQKLRAVKAPIPRDFSVAARLWAQAGNWARATAVLHVGRQLHPEDASLEELLRELGAKAGSRVGELMVTLNDRGVRVSEH
ncbi:MAG TPA: glycosyltransferase [Candidatus Acidoferrales bacterium]|nr:glycosyltransferase [Candidatus Acidoferrales bacterium]